MPALRKDLGVAAMTAVTVSMMLGVGIFFGPTLTARQFPQTSTIAAFWIAGGLVAMAGAWVFGRLAARYPLSGGPYVYVREAYGPLPAYLFAWTSLVIIAPTSSAVMASIFAANLSQLSPLTPRGLALMGVWGIAAFTFVNVMGVRLGGRVQNVLSALKVVLVAAIVVVLLRGASAPQLAEPIEGGGSIALALVGVLFAFGGWEYAVLASEEVRDGSRNVPRGLLLGSGIVTALYLLATFGFLAALGPVGVASAQALGPEAASRALPGAFAGAVAVAVAISAAGSLNAVTLLGPRATFAVARDRGGVRALHALASVSPRWGTPVVAILLQAALSTIYLLTGTFSTLAAYTVVGTGIFIVASALALFVFARRAGARVPPMEAGAALLVAGVYSWFLVFLWVDDPVTALGSFALVAAGVLPYVAYTFLRRRGVALP